MECVDRAMGRKRGIESLTRARNERSRNSVVLVTGGRISTRVSPRPPRSFRLSFSSQNSPTHRSLEGSLHMRRHDANRNVARDQHEARRTHTRPHVQNRQRDHTQLNLNFSQVWTTSRSPGHSEWRQLEPLHAS